MNKAVLGMGWKIVRPLAHTVVHKYADFPKKSVPRKILTVRIQGAGDVLLTTPALRALRRRFPYAEIHYLVGDLAAELVRHHPDVDYVISIPESILFSGSLRLMMPLIRKLRAEKYDLAVIFSRSAGLHAFLAACCIKFRVGFSKNGSGATLHLPVVLRDEIRYEALDYLELVHALGGTQCQIDLKLSITSEEDQEAKAVAKSAGLDVMAPFGILSVGGGRNAGWEVPQKCWDLSKFAAVAQQLDIPLAIVGDANDRKGVVSNFSSLNNVFNLCGKSSLMHTASLVKRASFLVTNDTVTLHMAVALGTPAVALFGPTHPKAILPQACQNIIVIQGKLPCAPCFWQGMPSHVSNFGEANFPGCQVGQGKSPCLDTISPTEVIDAIRKLTTTNQPGGSVAA